MLVLLCCSDWGDVCPTAVEVGGGVSPPDPHPALPAAGAVARCCNFFELLSAFGLQPTPAALSHGALNFPPERRSIMSHAILKDVDDGSQQ